MSKKSNNKTPNNSAAPPPPKKPLTAYFRYLSDNRENFRKKNPNEPEKRILTLVADAWKACSEAVKKKYEEMYQKDKNKYDEEIKEYTVKYGPIKPKKKQVEEEGEKKGKKASKKEKPKAAKK